MWLTLVERVEEDSVLDHVAAGGPSFRHVLERQAHCDGRSLAAILGADRIRALNTPRCVRWTDCEDQRWLHGNVRHREGEAEMRRLGSFGRCLLGAPRGTQRNTRLCERLIKLGGLR